MENLNNSGQPPTVLSNTLSCYPFGPLLVNSEITYSYGAAAITTGVLAILVALLNGFVFAALVSLKHYQTPPNMLLVLLTGLDFMNGVTVLPMYSVYMRNMAGRTIDCLLSRILIMFGYTIIITATAVIGLIAFQLYLGIVKPFWYHRIVNRSRLLRIVIAIWLVIVIAVVFVTFIKPELWRWFKSSVGGIFFLAYVVLWFVHIYIILATKDMNKVSSTRALPQSTKDLLTMERKLARMIVTIILTFGICYLPSIMYAVYLTIFGLSASTRSYFGPWIEIIAMSNSLWDPIIYCIRMKSVRIRISKMLRWRRQQCYKIDIVKLGIVPPAVLPVSVSFTSILDIYFEREEIEKSPRNERVQ